jgi:hypothetical protein
MKEILDDHIFKDNSKNKKHYLISLFFILELFVALTATLLAWYDIESIMITGPVGSLTGLVLFILSAKSGYKTGIAAGLSAPVFSIVCFAFIFINEWGTTQAYFPVSIVITLYTFFLAGLFMYSKTIKEV